MAMGTSETFVAPSVLPGTLLLLMMLATWACVEVAPQSGADPRCLAGPGDLVITEFFPDPKGRDQGREWFEIHNLSGVDLPLGGLTIEAGNPDRPRFHAILDELDPGIPAGAYITIGNGVHRGPTSDYSWPQMSLPNTAGTIAIWCGGTELDRVAYGRNDIPGFPDTPGPPGEGRSMQFCTGLLGDPATDPVAANDLADSWCTAEPDSVFDPDPTFPDLPGGRGTPGAPNHACIRPGTCLDQGIPRPIRPPAWGDVLVTEIYANPPGPDDKNMEWFEILAINDTDLAGLGVEHWNGRNRRVWTVAGPDCRTVSAGEWAVMAASADPDVNGGVARAIPAFPAGLSLYNAAGTLTLYRGDDSTTGTVVALAVHPGSSGALSGISLALDPATGIDPASPGNPGNWCPSVTTGLFQGLGTPGRQNDPCNVED